MTDFDLSVELCPSRKSGLRLSNPVMVASGTFGYGTEYAALVDIQRLGAIVCKGVTLRPRVGNPQPRIVETPAGMLNSIGLQNIGVRALVRDKAPVWEQWRVPVIVNIAGESYGEFRQLAAILEGVPGIAALEVNVSCPNVDQGGMEFGCDPLMAAKVTRVVRRESSLPVIVKLTPNAPDMRAVARAVADAGADALTVMNTVLGMAIDVGKKTTVMQRGSAGLSGPAIKPMALHHVYQLAGAVDIPVIGCGGISSTSDALEFLMAGAAAVQVGTANFVDPQTSIRIIDGLEDFLSNDGCASIACVIGAARQSSS